MNGVNGYSTMKMPLNFAGGTSTTSTDATKKDDSTSNTNSTNNTNNNSQPGKVNIKMMKMPIGIDSQLVGKKSKTSSAFTQYNQAKTNTTQNAAPQSGALATLNAAKSTIGSITGAITALFGNKTDEKS